MSATIRMQMPKKPHYDVRDTSDVKERPLQKIHDLYSVFHSIFGDDKNKKQDDVKTGAQSTTEEQTSQGEQPSPESLTWTDLDPEVWVTQGGVGGGDEASRNSAMHNLNSKRQKRFVENRIDNSEDNGANDLDWYGIEDRPWEDTYGEDDWFGSKAERDEYLKRVEENRKAGV